MCARACEVITVDGRAEARPFGGGAHEEELMQEQFAVEDVAAGDAGDVFDVDRRDDLFADDGAADVGRVFLDGGDDRFTEGFALGIVPATFDIIRRVLHETRHHMFSGRRHVGVDLGWHDYVDVRLFCKAPILRVVVGALDVIDARADGDRTVVQGVLAGQCGEIRKFAQRDVDLAR